jgi:CheY-like chemotaxis protein
MKVLIVEDNPVLQRLYGRALEMTGHTIVTANDGDIAITTAANENPDIILMDVMMPTMNGIEALRQIKANDATKAIPVIMLSANDDGVVMQKALQSGASRFLVKSNVEPSDIIGYIDQTVANNKL